MGDFPGVTLPKPIGFADYHGHSGIADANGVTQPDHGPAHKIDQFLQPAIYRSCAMGSAVHSWHNQGNGTVGDGGWAHVATEFDRQEMVTGYLATTVSGASSGSTLNVTAAGPAPLEYLVVGSLSNPSTQTEIVQVSAAYAGGTAVALQAAMQFSHAAGDPVFHAIKNGGRYLARSALVISDVGGNDVPYLGPGLPASPLSNTWQNGTFGTTPGASRGLTPFMRALRFTWCQFRSSVIYRDSHPSCIYGANWTAFAMSGFVANNGLASYPVCFNFGSSILGSYHYTTVAGSTVTFTTPPDFNGTAVDIFTFSYHDGGGALWDYSVAGATTVALTSHSAGTVYDDRNTNAVNMNDGVALGTGKTTGSAFRITGLNPGVNTITLKATAINTYGIFLGWGIEAERPPVILAAQQFRLGGFGSAFGYGLWSSGGAYIRRTISGAQTIASASGTNISLTGTVVMGAAGTGLTSSVYPNDTITIGSGATKETRRITGPGPGSGISALTVDAAWSFAHASGEAVIIGLQDADFVGGGWENTLDTQGALSVPGLNAAIASVAAEFDKYVATVNFDSSVNSPGAGSATPAPGANPNLANDGVHFTDTGGGVVADQVISKFNSLGVPTQKDLASYAVANRRTYVPTYNELFPTSQATAGGVSQFVNGWQNYYPLSTGGVYRVGFYKDSRTREVVVVGAITNYNGIRDDQLPSAAIIIPSGLRPRMLSLLTAFSSMGPAAMEANSDGYIYVTSGFWCAASPASGSAYLEFWGKWLPEG